MRPGKGKSNTLSHTQNSLPIRTQPFRPFPNTPTFRASTAPAARPTQLSASRRAPLLTAAPTNNAAIMAASTPTPRTSTHTKDQHPQQEPNVITIRQPCRALNAHAADEAAAAQSPWHERPSCTSATSPAAERADVDLRQPPPPTPHRRSSKNSVLLPSCAWTGAPQTAPRACAWHGGGCRGASCRT